MSIKVGRPEGSDLIAKVIDGSNKKLGYEIAKDKGMTFSAYLETLSPSEPGEKLDAFERLLYAAGIILKDDPGKGVYAGHGDLFFQSNLPESRILFPEFINRTIRAAMISRGDFLSYVVAEWEYSVTGIFRAFYLDDTTAGRQAGMRGQGSKNKIISASWSEKQVIAEPFGLEVHATYDFIRGASLPIITLLLQRVAMQKALDELALAIYVLVNGDASPSAKESSALTHTDLSAYQTAATGTKDIEYKSYLKWLSTFYPYKATTVIASMLGIVDLICMPKPSVDPALLYGLLDKSLTGGVPEIVANPFGNIAYVPSPDADVLGEDFLIALDKSMALQGHRDVGMDLVETDRIISGQFEKIVISNKVGFSKILETASKGLDCDD